MTTLKPCPFCGGTAELGRIGTNRQSCIVTCGDCGATVESNESGEHCGSRCNRREEGRKLDKIKKLLLHNKDARDFLVDLAELLDVEVTFR